MEIVILVKTLNELATLKGEVLSSSHRPKTDAPLRASRQSAA